MLIIALTGTIGSGKSIVAEYLKSKGFEYHSFSHIIVEETKKLGYSPTRENLQMVANKIRSNNKDRGILSRILLKKIKSNKVVLDGVRNTAEINVLKEKGNAYLVGIDAKQRIRFERIGLRGRIGEPKNYNEFKKIDRRENISGSNKNKIFEIRNCLKSADFLIMNNGTIEELKNDIDKILKDVLAKQ